eukprot:scaffold384_cov238-Pinguiococcus_pyrenoidosus.AAC.9
MLPARCSQKALRWANQRRLLPIEFSKDPMGERSLVRRGIPGYPTTTYDVMRPAKRTYSSPGSNFQIEKPGICGTFESYFRPSAPACTRPSRRDTVALTVPPPGLLIASQHRRNDLSSLALRRRGVSGTSSCRGSGDPTARPSPTATASGMPATSRAAPSTACAACVPASASAAALRIK